MCIYYNIYHAVTVVTLYPEDCVDTVKSISLLAKRCHFYHGRMPLQRPSYHLTFGPATIVCFSAEHSTLLYTLQGTPRRFVPLVRRPPLR